MKMVEFTCIICGFPYNVLRGEPEERMCHNCWEYDDIMDDNEERDINEKEKDK
jgi:rubredoxin